MKRLLAELKEYKAPSIKAPLFMIGEVGLELSLPFLMAYIIDNGVTKGDMKTVVIMGLLMLAVAFLSLICGALSAKYASFASAGFVKNLRCLRTSSGSLSAMWTAIPQQDWSPV